MEVLKNGKSINIISRSNSISPGKIPVIFLHGFTGSSEDWLFIFDKLDSKFFPIAVDLPGHGKTEVPENLEFYSTASYIDTINLIIEYFKIKKVILLGYSMGGRAALSFAVANPNKIIGLILESSTAGIENEKERTLRIESDSKLAEKLLIEGINRFVDYWMKLPFFRSLKSLNDDEYNEIISKKKNNSPQKLANSLLGFGTGQMPSLWSKLNLLKIPTLLIAGSLDTKFVSINKKMNELIPNSILQIIDDCGHNTHLENKRKFIILVNDFLKQFG